MSSDKKPAIVRPTSPHLSIYKPQISTVLSIMHRMTGLALFAGSALMVLWLWSAAYGPTHYATLHHLIASPIGQICLLGWTLAFYYHLGNGVRHLFWDIGMGFSLPQMEKTGIAVLVFTAVMTALSWWVIYCGGVH